MAVILNNEPSNNITLGDCNEFELTLSSGGDETQLIELAYQLQDSGDSPITDIDYPPYTGNSFIFDVRSELERRMVCKPPTPGLGDLLVEGDAEYWGLQKQYKLAYGERTTQLSDCDTTVALGNETSLKNIFNGYKTGWNWYAQGIMSNRAFNNEIYIWQDDWFVFNAFYGSVTYTITGYTDNKLGIGTELGAITKAAGIHFIGVGPNNMINGIDVSSYAYYTINVNDGVDLGTYTFRLKNCRLKQFREVIWKEPLGGWASIGFEGLGFGNIEETPIVANLKPPCSYFNNEGFYYNGKIANSTSRANVKMSKNIPPHDNTELFLNGLFASNNVYVGQYYGSAKTWRRVNIINKSTEFISENEIQLSLSLEFTMKSFANIAS